jgi:hypothetical protein
MDLAFVLGMMYSSQTCTWCVFVQLWGEQGEGGERESAEVRWCECLHCCQATALGEAV